MTQAEAFLQITVYLSLILLTLSFLIVIVRVFIGPTLPDRILALDTLIVVAIGYIAINGVKSGFYLYVDIAIALALVGFLATVAFARFVLSHGMTRGDEDSAKAEEKR